MTTIAFDTLKAPSRPFGSLGMDARQASGPLPALRGPFVDIFFLLAPTKAAPSRRSPG